MLTSCPRCGNATAKVKYDFGRENIVRCDGCTLLYLHPLPKPEETEAVYGEGYFKNEEFGKGDNESLFGYADYISERFNKQPQYASIAREIRELLPANSPARLLEVGCGLGYFLGEAFEEGFEVSGMDFNQAAVDRLRKKYAFPILVGALEQVELEDASVDCVAMFDVIEHLRDPFLSLDRIYSALAPGGLLVLSTVDSESWVSRLLGDRLEDFRRTREHLFFFSRETLRSVLDEHGFEVFEIRSIGHTFELAFLLDRLELYNKPIFSLLRRACEAIGIGSLQIHINPLTKMIAFARKKGVQAPYRPDPQSATPAALPDEERAVAEELVELERSAPRHYRWVADLIAPWLGRSVLEVGSGIGVVSKHLVHRCDSLTLSDFQEYYLEALRHRFGEGGAIRYRLLDLNQPPYDVGQDAPDTIVCLNVLEHLERDEDVLKGFAEILPEGGRVILQVPNYPRLFGTLDESYGHHRRYTPDSLREVLSRAGFETVGLRRFNPYSIPGWILAGNIMGASRLDPRTLRIYDAMVPVLRRIDFATRFAGLSLLACGEKRSVRPIPALAEPVAVPA